MDFLHAYLADVERDRSLLEPKRLRKRVEVLDRLETYLAGLPESVDGFGAGNSLRDRIKALCRDFEAVNAKLCLSIRCDIQSGKGVDALHEWVDGIDDCDGDHYDHLDALIEGVLQMDEPAVDVKELAPDMVFYQPTPARHTFDLLDRVGLGEHDVLLDLGAGLGHVVLVAALCSRARCIGIEREAAFVDCARRCAQALNIGNATFLEGDARDADLSQGTVFYLYTPFTGAMLRQILDRLKTEAAARPLRIVTLGPCTAIISQEPWLQSNDSMEAGNSRLAVFHSI